MIASGTTRRWTQPPTGLSGPDALPPYGAPHSMPVFPPDYALPSKPEREDTIDSDKLIQDIREMSHNVFATQQLLDKVSNVLIELTRYNNSDKQLLNIRYGWDKLAKEFAVVVLKTRRLASAGARTIADFTENLGPFLGNSEVSANDKMDEIAAYREGIMESKGYKEAEVLRSELHAVMQRVNAFENSWTAYTTQTAHSISLASSIKDIQQDVKIAGNLLLQLAARTVTEGVGAAFIIATGALSKNIPHIATAIPLVKLMGSDFVDTCRAFKERRHLKKQLRAKTELLSQDFDKKMRGKNAISSCDPKLASLQMTLDVFAGIWTAMITDLDALHLLFEPAQSEEDHHSHLDRQLEETFDSYTHIQKALNLYARNMSSFGSGSAFLCEIEHSLHLA